jgi:two-component system, OmpR family, response regulator RegX3
VPPCTVLIIADNANSAGGWEDALRRRGIESIHLRYGIHPQNLSLPDRFNLVLIDSYAASDTALAICAIVRAASDKPILLLTHENDERYQLKAYEVGVDECMVAPMSVLLFLAKIQVWLQRISVTADMREEISESGFLLNIKTRHVVTPNGKAVKLSIQEARLLHLFLMNPCHILEKDFLQSRVWSHQIYGDKKMLTNLVYRLRQKIESPASSTTYIQYIAGEGYRWEPHCVADYTIAHAFE